MGLTPFWLSAGCKPRGVAKPPPGPAVADPLAAIPPDLELTLRVAVERLREAVPGPTLARLQEDSRLTASLGDPLILRALQVTRTAWTGLRLGHSPEQTDNVLVLEGQFGDVVPRRGDGWTSPDDLGAGWQCWQRRDKVARALPARVYARSDELLVFVSEAEIDAVERHLGQARPSARLEPPERGVLALASSMPALARVLRREAPQAAKLLADGTSVTGFADVDTSAIDVDLSFEFREAERAERVARAATLLTASLAQQAGALAELAAAVQVEPLGKVVSVRLKLSAQLLANIEGAFG